MRYAVYFTPPINDPLTRVATNWLGRNAFTDENVEAPAVSGLDDPKIATYRAAPRRYGFHGTLKAPFHLAADKNEAELLSALKTFAATVCEFAIPRLVISRIGPFFALVPSQPVAELNDLAARAVRELDCYRAPLTETDLERRAPHTLSPEKLENLQRWGYPYVFEEFRFHMTLTGPVEVTDADRIGQALQAHFDPVMNEPVEVRSIALFTEAERGGPFKVHSLFPLAADEQRQSA
ncbi:MAG: DUF1045 domain-containing protein [Pseudomonadota bacterium]